MPFKVESEIAMNQDTPILMITLQIPVTAETTADEVLDAIGRQVSDALLEFREQQTVPANEARDQAEFKSSLVKETEESLSPSTHQDLLSRLGYPTRA